MSVNMIAASLRCSVGSGIWPGILPTNRQMSILIGLPLRFQRGAHFQSQRVQADETGRVALIVGGFLAFHGRDFWIVEALRTFPTSDDDVALIKFEANQAGDVTLGFGDERLKRFAFGRKPETVVNELAVFRNQTV